MSHSMRFIGVAVAGWIGFRVLSLGLVPGAEAFAFDRPSDATEAAREQKASRLPPIIETEFPPIEPVAPYPPMAPLAAPYGYGAPWPGYPMQPIISRPVAYYVPAAMPRGREAPVRDWSLVPGESYGAVTPLDQWPVGPIARGEAPPPHLPGQSTAPVHPRRLDRLSLSAWAMLRREPGPASLAANGMLGGSQGGARLLWRFDPRLAASLRTSAPIGGVQRSAEVAAGVRWQPVMRWPVALTAERRQSFGPDKGRSAFALFAEGGVYDRPIAAQFSLDAYLQGGVVGLSDRAFFVDGSAVATRPLWRQFSGGIGVWGAAQPGLSRIDAGPRVSMGVGSKMRVHLDYRQRLAGTALPGSGPVLTLAGEF